jgi:hypothetical protein
VGYNIKQDTEKTHPHLQHHLENHSTSLLFFKIKIFCWTSHVLTIFQFFFFLDKKGYHFQLSFVSHHFIFFSLWMMNIHIFFFELNFFIPYLSPWIKTFWYHFAKIWIWFSSAHPKLIILPHSKGNPKLMMSIGLKS